MAVTTAVAFVITADAAASGLMLMAAVIASARTRSALVFDPQKEQFVSNAAAAALLKREYRDHWATPKA